MVIWVKKIFISFSHKTEEKEILLLVTTWIDPELIERESRTVAVRDQGRRNGEMLVKRYKLPVTR